MKIFPNYVKNEEGAVTVDWVVLTSAIVALAIAVMLSVGNATTGLANKISGAIATMSAWDFTP